MCSGGENEQRNAVACVHHRHSIVSVSRTLPLDAWWKPHSRDSLDSPFTHLRTNCQAMASVESVPAFLQPGVQVSQPPHLEGDPSLATEILPGPPPLASIQQAAIPRKDHKKPIVTYSYLPASDPGTTYTHFAGTLSAAPTEMDGSRRKRGRLDKGYVCCFSFDTKRAEIRVTLDHFRAHNHISKLCRFPSAFAHTLSSPSTASKAADPSVLLLVVLL